VTRSSRAPVQAAPAVELGSQGAKELSNEASKEKLSGSTPEELLSQAKEELSVAPTAEPAEAAEIVKEIEAETASSPAVEQAEDAEPIPAATAEELTLSDGRIVCVFDSPEAAAAGLVAETAVAARAAIAAKGAFSLAVSGGEVATALATLSKQPDLDFGKFHVFFCYDDLADLPSHSEACLNWLDACSVPKNQIYVMPKLQPEAAAATYTASMCMLPESVIADSAEGLPAVDLALLSTGDDGSCAGVRPGSSELSKTKSGEIVLFSEQPDRLTLSMDFMNAACHAILLAAEPSRAEAVSKGLGGSADCPVAQLKAPRTEWFVTAKSFATFRASQA